MTIRIPLRTVAFVVYTLALLGGAFGIAFAVVEWRTDDDTDRQASEQPTVEPSPQRLLTPTEAEAVALRFISDQRTLNASEFECQANDYNEPRGEWIVECSATFTVHYVATGTDNEMTARRTIAVNDQTAKARQLSP